MKLLFIVLMSLVASQPVMAEDPDPTIAAGFAKLAADKLQETRPVVLLSPEHKPAYSAFLPVWSGHDRYDKDSDNKEIVSVTKVWGEIGIGGKYELDSRSSSAFIGTSLNAVNLSGKVWNFQWARDHVTRSKFPPIFIGPAYALPLNWADLKTTSMRRDLRLMASVAFTF